MTKYDPTPCAAEGCGHVAIQHLVEPHAVCVGCFDQYPHDDSPVAGGIYHRFVQ